MKDMQFRLLEEMLPWQFRTETHSWIWHGEKKSSLWWRIACLGAIRLFSSLHSRPLCYSFPTWKGRKSCLPRLISLLYFFPQNPEMVAGEKKKFVMRPPQVMRVGTKKTAFVNFNEMAKM